MVSRSWLMLAALAAVSLSPVQATVIHAFSGSSTVTDTNGGAPSTSDGGMAIVDGPFTNRELIASSNGSLGVTTQVGANLFTVSSDVLTTGTGQAILTGGGFHDFSSALAFTIEFFTADNPGGDIALEIIDSSLNSSGLVDFTGAGTLGTSSLLLSIPSSSFAGVNLSSVLSMRLVVTAFPAGNDLAFRNLATSDVPEPVSMAMVGAGLLALGMMRRRKRAV